MRRKIGAAQHSLMPAMQTPYHDGVGALRPHARLDLPRRRRGFSRCGLG
jgi:hypothetical protein